MDIKGIGNNYNKYTELYKKQENAGSKEAQHKTDKLELSEAAKKLQSQGIQAKDLSAINSKIESGYYNTDEVINKVADEIIKELSKK